jgi:hypothetical protein
MDFIAPNFVTYLVTSKRASDPSNPGTLLCNLKMARDLYVVTPLQFSLPCSFSANAIEVIWPIVMEVRTHCRCEAQRRSIDAFSERADQKVRFRQCHPEQDKPTDTPKGQ